MQKTLDMPDSDEIEALLQSMNIHESTFGNLRRGLATIRRLPFLVPHAPMNAVDSILEYLERGMNVVLEFGRYRDITAYMLVANMLASRIYKRYQEKTEVSMASKVSSTDAAGYHD